MIVHQWVNFSLFLYSVFEAIDCFSNTGILKSNHELRIVCKSKSFKYSVYRNVLVESARIARGNVSPLTELKTADFDAVVIPGGFGAAKNL